MTTTETPAAMLWRLSATLPDEERHRVRAWLTSAERALRPPRRDGFPLGLTQRERVRQALLPRPNEFYPGDRDHVGGGDVGHQRDVDRAAAA